MKKRICIVEGVRTPMCKAGDKLSSTSADELGVYCVKYLLDKTLIKASSVDEVIFGNVSMPADAANIGRVIALKAGVPEEVPAFTVQRNCASGMESIISGMQRIQLGDCEVVIAGGTESMSNIPFLYKKSAVKKFTKLSRARGVGQKLGGLLSFRPKDFSPIIGLLSGLIDPVTGNIMGKTAEFLAREFHITRAEQDEFALQSHVKANNAQQAGLFNDEIVPVPVKPHYNSYLEHDVGIDESITIKKLAKKRAYFDKLDGTVTVGNSCQITDGAAAVILTSEKYAQKHDLKILGYVNHYSHAALSPDRMGLGPVYSMSKLLKERKKDLSDFDLFEINEAFAAQVLANLKAIESDEFAKKFLGRDKALGKIDPEKLNVNGGAIALGHPVGMTGTRIVIHLLKELKRQNLKTGIASLCVGGGQGVALEIETI